VHGLTFSFLYQQGTEVSGGRVIKRQPRGLTSLPIACRHIPAPTLSFFLPFTETLVVIELTLFGLQRLPQLVTASN